jgi:hypothetical protein
VRAILAGVLRVGPYVVTRVGHSEVEGETPDGEASIGQGRLFVVTDGAESRLTVRDTRWANGERDLVAAERHDSPQRFDTLVERLRLPVLSRGGDLYVELRQVRLKANGRGNLFAPDEEALDHGAGVLVARELERHGATSVGTREQLLSDEGRSRNRLGALFPPDADLVPLVAYICTRVAPVAQSLSA